MTVKGVSLTTREIIGSDGSGEGNRTTIFKRVDSLSINTGSVKGNEYQNFDPNEAWVFCFDADVILSTIGFAGLEQGETMKITILDGSHGGMGTARTVTNEDYLLIEKQVAAGTDIRIEQMAGKTRIESITIVSE
jgi:hypothetical protein